MSRGQRPAHPLRTAPPVHLDGVDLAPLSEEDVVAEVAGGWAEGRGGWIVTVNVDILRSATRDQEHRDLIARADLVVADGMPIIWATRFAGTPLPERVTGSSLVETLSAAAGAAGRSVYVLGGEPGVPEAAAQALVARHPGLRVAGVHSPAFGFDGRPDDLAEAVDLVVAAQPDLVLVGLGFPKQERVIELLRPRLPTAWFLGCGGGIAMAAGQFRRAPRAFQAVGAEWLFRLALEPGRLADRYLRRDLPYAVTLLGRSAARGVRPAPPPVVSAPSTPGYVCFSAQDWWYHNQAHSDFQLMRAVAESRKVLVINSIGMRMPRRGTSTFVARRITRKLRSVARLLRRPLPDLPDFYVLSPLPLPLYGSPTRRRLSAAFVRAQVRVAMAVLRIREPVVVVTLPPAWDVVAPMRRRSLVFNRSDRHSAFPEADTETIEAMERELLDHADHVVYVSQTLQDEESSRTGARARFLDHGVDLDHFRAVPPEQWPTDVRDLPGPRVGFFGALDDFLVDFALVEHLARALPDVSVVLIGDSTHDMGRLTALPNVHWLGPRPYSEIPAYGSAFDVAIMPWLENDWIRHSNPIKLKEYLALGLPVVSRDFDQLRDYRDRVRVGRSPEEFVAAVMQTLRDGGPGSPVARRESVMRYSWLSRAALLMSLTE